MVGRRRHGTAVLALLFLLPRPVLLAQSAPIARSAAAVAAPALDSTATTPELILQLRALESSPATGPLGLLSELAEHDDGLVRLAVARLLTQRPGLEPAGTLGLLAEDADDSVALASLLGLARSADPEAALQLSGHLTEPDATRREIAAIGLAVRSAVASDQGLPAVDDDVVALGRPQIVTDEGRHWLDAIAHYRALDMASRQWVTGQATLLQLETAVAVRSCVARVRANPGLLTPPSTDPASARLTEPASWPDSARLRPAADSAATLLATGRHDALADRRFTAEDEARALRRFIVRLEGFCANSDAFALPGVDIEALGGEAPPPALSDTPGWAGVGLGIVNSPSAWRDGGTDFLIGEDIELVLIPELRLTLLRAEALAPRSAAAREPPVVDGWALDMRAGAWLSTAFFKDRSRPEASVVFVHDRPVDLDTRDGRARSRRLSAHAELSAGTRNVYRDLSLFPAPFVAAGLRAERVRSEQPTPGPSDDARIFGDLELVNYVWDDPNAPPRDRRWLQATVAGFWLAGPPEQAVRFGVRGGAGARSGERVDHIAATAAEVAPMLRWRQRDLRLDLWVGAGFGWLPTASAPDVDQGPFPDVIAGFVAHYRSTLGALELGFTVGLTREVMLMGRNGYVGAHNRIEADLRLRLTGGMRDAIGLTLFAEGGEPYDTGKDIAWGGLELFIPVGITDIDQELAYVMRYLSLVDEERFGSRAQEVFEAVLTAGSRF